MSELVHIQLDLDRRTAELLRDALHDLGEHQAAGAPIAPAAQEEADKLGAFLHDLDTKLGGTGQFA